MDNNILRTKYIKFTTTTVLSAANN